MTTQKIKIRTEIVVDMSEFGLEELVAEIESRQDDAARLHKMRLEHRKEELRRDAMEEAGAAEGEWKRIPGLHSGDHHPLHSIYYALKFGKPEHAIDLMRDYINDEFGVAL